MGLDLEMEFVHQKCWCSLIYGSKFYIICGVDQFRFIPQLERSPKFERISNCNCTMAHVKHTSVLKNDSSQQTNKKQPQT